MEQKKNRLYPSAPMKNIDLEQHLKKTERCQFLQQFD